MEISFFFNWKNLIFLKTRNDFSFKKRTRLFYKKNETTFLLKKKEHDFASNPIQLQNKLGSLFQIQFNSI